MDEGRRLRGRGPGLGFPAPVSGRTFGGLPPGVSERREVRSLRTGTATPRVPGRVSGVQVRGRVRFEIGEWKEEGERNIQRGVLTAFITLWGLQDS